MKSLENNITYRQAGFATKKQQEFLVKWCGFTRLQAGKTSFDEAKKQIQYQTDIWDREKRERFLNRSEIYGWEEDD